MNAIDKATEIRKKISSLIGGINSDKQFNLCKKLAIQQANDCYQASFATYLMFDTNSDIEVQIHDYWKEVIKELKEYKL